MVIRVYWASVTGNRKISGDQLRLRNFIETMNLESTWIDITTCSSVMKMMRVECMNPKALPPQIFNDDVYLGNVDDLNQSIEDGCVKQWLRIEVDSDANDVEQKTENNIVATDSHANNIESDPTNANSNPGYSITKVDASKEIKASKSVSSAINNFENINKSPEVSRKTITLQFGNNIDQQESDNATKAIDEERRRRILGLPPTEKNGSTDSNLIDKTNGQMSYTNVKNDGIVTSKIGSIFDMPDTTS